MRFHCRTPHYQARTTAISEDRLSVQFVKSWPFLHGCKNKCQNKLHPSSSNKETKGSYSLSFLKAAIPVKIVLTPMLTSRRHEIDSHGTDQDTYAKCAASMVEKKQGKNGTFYEALYMGQQSIYLPCFLSNWSPAAAFFAKEAALKWLRKWAGRRAGEEEEEEEFMTQRESQRGQLHQLRRHATKTKHTATATEAWQNVLQSLPQTQSGTLNLQPRLPCTPSCALQHLNHIARYYQTLETHCSYNCDHKSANHLWYKDMGNRITYGTKIWRAG